MQITSSSVLFQKTASLPPLVFVFMPERAASAKTTTTTTTHASLPDVYLLVHL